MALKLKGSTSGFVGLDAPSVAGNNTLILPENSGSAFQVFANDITAGVTTFTQVTVSRNGDLTVPGTISIGGTLTYEDVTSVDSVGIVTARSGVRINGGGLTIIGDTTGIKASGISTLGGDVSITGVTTISYSGTSQYGLDVYNPTSGSSGARVRAGDNDGQYAFLVENGAGTNLFEVLAGGGGARLRSGDLFLLDKITHYDDVNTSIRFPAADTVSIETAGSERLRIQSDGDVGIGTNNPDSKLHVYGATTSYIKIETGDGTTNPIVMHKNPDKIFHTGLRGDFSDSYVIRDHSSSANRLVIDTNGKICLGTHNTNFADNDGTVSIVNAASAGTENTLLTLWNPTTVADARASIDFLTNANYGTGRDGGFIRASNDGSSAAAHLIFGKIINETYTKTVKFDTGGDVEIVDGDLVIQTSGHGIDFSAAANSNAGASSSILNDYEEGVYQPTMTGSTSGSHTFVSYTHLAYTKIGRFVHIQGYINTNGGTLVGNLRLSLPFTVSNNATGHSRYPAIFISWRSHGWSGNVGNFAFAPQPNTNYGEFISVARGGSHIWVNNTHVGNNYNIRVGGCYITDA